METARDLFEHELRDIYDAEHKLVRALDTMATKVSNPELSQSFKEHQKVTEGQIKRLDQVFGIIDRAPRREACDGINGLISEFSSFVSDESPSEKVLDVFATAAAQKVEHYEICSYKALIKLSDQLGLSEAAELFEQTLREEQETATELETFSEKLGQELPVS